MAATGAGFSRQPAVLPPVVSQWQRRLMFRTPK
jgi:hypothetical protein